MGCFPSSFSTSSTNSNRYAAIRSWICFRRHLSRCGLRDLSDHSSLPLRATAFPQAASSGAASSIEACLCVACSCKWRRASFLFAFLRALAFIKNSSAKFERNVFLDPGGGFHQVTKALTLVHFMILFRFGFISFLCFDYC